MNPTRQLHDAGQSLWLDNITHAMLTDGRLAGYRDQYHVSGLTSNPSIFDNAVKSGTDYDAGIRAAAERGLAGEELFFELALEDLRTAADIFRPVWERTDGVDGWVSLEVSPELANDTDRTLAQVADLNRRGDRPNLFIKIPGTPAGLPAIEESIFRGIPVNVTLLFDAAQYRAAADAYLRGVERRVAAGLNPRVASVASVFMSRWDSAVAGQVPDDLRHRLALAVGGQVYRAYREVMASDRFLALANQGARLQRLLWASTSTKDPEAEDTLYVRGLFSPLTVNTMPDKTLLAFADHGRLDTPLDPAGGDSEAVLDRFRAAGIDPARLAVKLQEDGAAAFVASWRNLVEVIETRAQAIAAG